MITLNGQVYRAVLNLAGQTVVIVQRSSQWRRASAEDARKVLAGLRREMFQVVS